MTFPQSKVFNEFVAKGKAPFFEVKFFVVVVKKMTSTFT